MKNTKWWVATSVIALGAAVAVGLHPARPALGGSGAAQIKVTAKEFVFTPKVVSTSAGQVQFVVTNTGTIEHTFVSDELKIKSRPIKPGQTVTITATAKPGTYKFYCDIPGHKEIGMTATLTAK